MIPRCNLRTENNSASKKMTTMFSLTYRHLILFCLLLPAFGFSQVSNTDTLPGLDEVDIVKAYEPILISSNKIPFAPNLPNIEKSKPDAQQYTFNDIKGSVEHPQEEIRPVRAAVSKPEKSPFFYAKVGLGFPMTPLLQLVLTNPVQTKVRAGVDADFIYTKSFKQSYQRYTNLKVRGFADFFIKKAAVISADAFYKYDQHFFYGYSDFLEAGKDSLKTAYHRFGASFRLRSIKASPFYYHGDFSFVSATNKNTFHKPDEFTFNGDLEAAYTIKSHYTLGGILLINDVAYRDNDSVFNNNQNHYTVQAIPYGKLQFKIWQLSAGPNVVITNRKFYILPEIINQLQLYKDYLVMYNEWKTQVKINSMNNLSLENPFLLTSNYTNSVDETRTIAGLRGTFKGFGYDVKFSQLVSRNNARFIQNTYGAEGFSDVVFDVQSVNTKAWNPHFALSYDRGKQFGAKVWFDYFIYNKNTATDLSYVPKIKAGFTTFYNWDGRLYVSLDISGQSKVNGVEVQHGFLSDTYVLHPVKGLVDMNISATYYINKHIGVFADLNNMGFQQWQRFYHYPTYNFQFIAGVKLSY